MRQQDNEYTEVVSERLESALLNMKLLGGNMHPEELQSTEKVINNSRSYNDTTINF